MLLVKSVYDLSEIVSEINKDDPYRAKMGFNRVFRWKCFRTQLPRVKFNHILTINRADSGAESLKMAFQP